ncbi:MscS Mechanosensitive ion channel [Nitrosomonas mobilis]|uniref:MscS Mechanosensitive ion channel n=2 Tax=Nitrosomonas mobilis TaxID=51642 RepID=A0A1G5SBZ8_9PROT|nr:MscS Mechanosensitive ion channel [Nitrosomonas mobilis]
MIADRYNTATPLHSRDIHYLIHVTSPHNTNKLKHMNKFLFIAVMSLLTLLTMTNITMCHANKLDDKLQAMQAKLGALGEVNPEETPQKKRLREIFSEHLQILRDHQDYLDKTANYSQQLESYPQQIATLRQHKIPSEAGITSRQLIKSTLNELERQLVTVQASLSELKNQQQKSISDQAQLRQRMDSIQEELASILNQRSALNERPAVTSKDTDKKILNALTGLRDAQFQALTDKTRMLELETLILPYAAEIISLQEKLLLIPKIENLSQQMELLIGEINLRRMAETRQVIEQSEQFSDEKIQHHPELKQLAADNKSLAQKLNDYAKRTKELTNQRAHDENRFALIAQSHIALQQRLELGGEDTDLGTHIRKQFKKIMIKPDTSRTERELSNTKLDLYQLEQERLQIMDNMKTVQHFLKNTEIPSADSAEYKELTNTFQKLKQSREQVVEQYADVLQGYIKELQLYLSIQTQLTEKIEQHQVLLRENLLVTRSAKPVTQITPQDFHNALDWFDSPKTQRSFTKTISSSWQELVAIFSIYALFFILFRSVYWPAYLRWEATGNSLRGKVNQDRLIYPFGMLMNCIVVAGYFFLPWQLAVTIIQNNSSSEIGHAMAASLQVAAVAIFCWAFLLLLFRPSGLLSHQFKCDEKLVNKMRHDIKRFAPFIVVLVVLIAFMDALDEDQVRNMLGRFAFVLLCLLLAIFASSWIGFGRKAKQFYQGMVFNPVLSPKYWMTALLLLQGYMITMVLIGYYFAAIYQYILVFQSLSWVTFFTLLYYVSSRSLLIVQRQIAYKRAIERREEIRAQRAQPDKSEADWIDENYVDVKTISRQSATLLKIGIWGLLITALLGIWIDVLPALSFLEKITLWQTSSQIDGEIVSQSITLKALLVALIVFGLAIIAAHNLPGTLELLVLRHLSLNTGTGYAITTLLRYVIVVAGVTATFQTLGMEWSSIQWLVAALGVGLGFGLQEIFANFVSGVILLFERPIRVGDLVTLNTTTGTVNKIHIRATTLIDFDRKEIVVPNKIFITQQLTNWSLSDQITRIVLPVGIAYGSDCETARRLLLEIASEHPIVLKDPEPSAYFVNFGNSSLNFELRVFCELLQDRLKLTHEINMAINHRFAEAGIDIAFPQLDVHLYNQPRRQATILPPTIQPG